MERIQALIDKLYQQKQLNSNPAQMLLTVQMLQSELLKLQQKNGTLGTAKVAVTLPVNMNFTEEIYTSEDVNPEDVQPVKEKPEVKAASVPPPATVFEKKEPPPPTPVKEEPPRKFINPAFEQVEQQAKPASPKKELHEVIAENKESLNDRLKQEKIEVVHTLKDSPIKDLRKGIGINDRFTFVSELFRGDEAMYERSIKTINSFHILSEAEYWINRELKVKQGWNDTSPLVQHFYQLVRRRFS